jgi:hypothetical protein
MPLPAILGVGLLAGVASKLFGLLFDLFARVVVRRYAFFVAAVTVLFGVFWAALNLALTGVSLSLGPDLLAAVKVIMPSTLDEMVATVITIRISEAVFVFNARLVMQRVLI